MNMAKTWKADEVAVRWFSIPDLRAAIVEEPRGNIIEGHPAVYDQKTSIGLDEDPWFYEIIERGAFDGCDFDDVLFSVNHEFSNIPLARSRRNNANSTLQLSLDETGLFVRASLDVERNTEARSLYSAVERGDIDGMSFTFRVANEKWEDMGRSVPTRRIQKIAKVREVSAVTYPAYLATDIHARSDQAALENARQALENARGSTLENEKNELEALRLRALILGNAKR
jgi:HK97 family phage prohead protease